MAAQSLHLTYVFNIIASTISHYYQEREPVTPRSICNCGMSWLAHSRFVDLPLHLLLGLSVIFYKAKIPQQILLTRVKQIYLKIFNRSSCLGNHLNHLILVFQQMVAV